MGWHGGGTDCWIHKYDITSDRLVPKAAIRKSYAINVYSESKKMK